jgi:hypothetical protein
MNSTEQFQRRASDPLLEQAEKILLQRQSRSLVIDRDILGEPGWDILLYAFISHRKGLVCSLSEAASTIDLGLPTTQRWVDLLTSRGLLVRRESFFAISEEAELKLTKMFKKQISEVIQAINERWQPRENNSRQAS